MLAEILCPAYGIYKAIKNSSSSRIRTTPSPATPRERANRQAVWKLLGLLLVEYKATDNAMWPELRRLLSHVGDRGFSSQMTDFIAEHLKDRVSF